MARSSSTRASVVTDSSSEVLRAIETAVLRPRKRQRSGFSAMPDSASRTTTGTHVPRYGISSAALPGGGSPWRFCARLWTEERVRERIARFDEAGSDLDELCIVSQRGLQLRLVLRDFRGRSGASASRSYGCTWLERVNSRESCAPHRGPAGLTSHRRLRCSRPFGRGLSAPAAVPRRIARGRLRSRQHLMSRFSSPSGSYWNVRVRVRSLTGGDNGRSRPA